jgi:transcriptional regulator with XRE-family HTH domain
MADKYKLEHHNQKSHTDTHDYNNIGLTAKATHDNPRTPIPTTTNTIGTRIVSSRISQGLYQADLIKLTGLSQAMLSQIEQDKSTPTIPTIRKIARALKEPIFYIGCYDHMPETTFAEQLKKARYYHGFTIPEAAQFLGVNERTIRNWENGRQPLERYRSKLKQFIDILQEGR